MVITERYEIGDSRWLVVNHINQATRNKFVSETKLHPIRQQNEVKKNAANR